MVSPLTDSNMAGRMDATPEKTKGRAHMIMPKIQDSTTVWLPFLSLNGRRDRAKVNKKAEREERRKLCR